MHYENPAEYYIAQSITASLAAFKKFIIILIYVCIICVISFVFVFMCEYLFLFYFLIMRENAKSHSYYLSIRYITVKSEYW